MCFKYLNILASLGEIRHHAQGLHCVPGPAFSTAPLSSWYPYFLYLLFAFAIHSLIVFYHGLQEEEWELDKEERMIILRTSTCFILNCCLSYCAHFLATLLSLLLIWSCFTS